MPPGRAEQEVGAELVAALRGLPKGLRKRVRPNLMRAAQPILADARRRAGWSSRIPRSLVLRVSFSQRNAGVRIVARRAVAPHARVYEGLARGGSRAQFRHPVFGNREVWRAQRTRPFLLPAVQAGRGDVLEAMNDAVAKNAAAAGWRIK